MSLFEATASAGATALNAEGIICSSTASFTATSTISYADALIKAKTGAKKVAKSEAEFTANVVSQSTEVTLGLVEKDGIIGVIGTNYGDYLFWDSYTNEWAVGDEKISIGSNAGQTGQDFYAVAVGNSAGQTKQGHNAVAVGNGAGQTEQGLSAVAVGNGAGQTKQGLSAVAIGAFAGLTTQGDLTVAIGNGAGQYAQEKYAVALGHIAGQTNQGEYAVAVGIGAGKETQGKNTVAVGAAAGQNYQEESAVAVGVAAGYNGQKEYAVAVGAGSGKNDQGESAVAIGAAAGYTGQNKYAVAIGVGAGQTDQEESAVAIGDSAGQTSQKKLAVAIGGSSGLINQGEFAVAVGSYAGQTGQSNNSIVLNASGIGLNGSESGFYVNPVRNISSFTGSTGVMVYDTGTNEITYKQGKTFIIDHPLDQDKYLVHACLEGPEAGVYYRGKGQITNNSFTIIELPEYVDKLAKNFTAHVTPIYNGHNEKTMKVSDVEKGSFRVYGENGRFNWVVYGERSVIVVEPKKSNVEVKGTGPYKWI